jgi:hypothetical protein
VRNLNDYSNRIDIYLIQKKSDIDVMSILNDYTLETSFISESTGIGVALSNMISKVVKVILDAIASVFDMISGLFTKENISKEEYLKSRQGDMTFDYDIVKQQKYINAKVKDGNSLMKRILRGENVHDKVVEFVNGAARMLDTKEGRNKIYAAAAPIVYGQQVELKKTVKEFEELNRDVLYKKDYPERFNFEDSKAIMREVQILSGRANMLTAMYFREFNKLNKKDMKRYKTMRIK